jgi:hypothetical protein
MKSLQKHYKVVQRFGGNLYSFNIKPQFGAEERGTYYSTDFNKKLERN